MANDDKLVAQTISQLKSGARLTKQKNSGKKFPRQFFLHEREGYVTYDKSRKIFGKPRLYHVKDIDEIRTGFHAEIFRRLQDRGNIKATDADRSFSILYDNHRKEEHFIAPDKKTRDLWITGLEHLLSRHSLESQGRLLQQDNWILNFFYAADKDRSGSLTRKECRDLLLNGFNVQVPDDVFKKLFNNADKSGDGTISAQEFIQFFKLLTRRRDLYEIMRRYTEIGHEQTMDKIYMEKGELIPFLQVAHYNRIQHINRPEELQKLITEHELNVELQQQGRLGLDGFRNMLLSDDFNILNLSKAQTVYQDMTRPLCDYYINTSHNTYLFYSQLTGDSNPEAYSRVLLLGCRAVELDCYDGDHGPVVYHAHTLVKPCSFESIISTMQPNLFKKSPYPVILNIENHCSPEYQKQMAQILKKHLRDQLISEPLPNRDPRVLPSPEDLKYKVLVRSKKIATKNEKFRLRPEDDDDSIFNPLSKNIQPELADLFVYLQNVPYKDYEEAKRTYVGYHSTSLDEKHLIKISEEDPVGLIQQTTWRLLRSYPGGLRQDSSNPDPIHNWNFGIQLVAVNHQNEDDVVAMYYGKFLDNGGCGYILKPDYLINALDTEFNPWDSESRYARPQSISITIISGQFLPRSSVKSTDITDPYIRLSTHGVFCDNNVGKTNTVNNNGFDPNWNETFQFRIKFPELCLLYFAVMDYDKMSKDDRVAYFCAPLTMLQRGFRHIHLRANNGDKTYSTLFVYIDIQSDSNDGYNDITRL